MRALLINSMASDASVVQSARVSTQGSRSMDAEADAGLINYLMRERHASPFEHSVFTFLIEAPIFVAREFMRHRAASYNELSGRYSVIDTEYYYPEDRPLIQVGKPGDYTFSDAPELREPMLNVMDAAYGVADESYKMLLEMGVAKEVARMVLPVGVYTSWYVTINARNLMNFLHLRLADNAQWEIRQIAGQMEEFFAQEMPLTHNAWRENGRGSI
jgi:thymidylate synthase (FAD)